MGKKRKRDVETVFRPKRDNAFRTVKTSLKSILRGLDGTKEVIEDIVFRCNDIVTEAYQFIRLYCLHLFNTQQPLPTLDEKFIIYAIKALGIRDARGRNPPMQISNQSWMHSTSAISRLFSIMTRNMIFETSHTTFPTSFVKCIQPSITI